MYTTGNSFKYHNQKYIWRLLSTVRPKPDMPIAVAIRILIKKDTKICQELYNYIKDNLTLAILVTELSLYIYIHIYV